MKKMILILLTLSLFFGSAGVAMSASTDSHTVTVIVSAINELAISGGNLTLTISAATAGSEPTDAVDNTTCDLAWTTNEASKKITVASSIASPTFTLKVVAQNVTGGTAASEVTLSTTATDFITSVATTTGSADLQYTASATAAQGTTAGEAHTVTYTLTTV